jgi:hypothetical protein
MKNKAPRPTGDKGEQPWFQARRESTRKRNKLAKASRKRNRRK